MNRNFVLFALSFVMVVFMLMVIQESAQAIPPFARKYETSCSTCHVAIPKRNAFGEAFRKNGYEIPGGDADYIKQKQVELGSPEWKEVWPNGLWPGAIPPSFPLGAYIHQRATLDVKKKDDGGTDLSPNLEMPHEFEIFVGGTLGEGIGFFGEWVAFEKMKDAEGLKSMYIQFNAPLGPDNLLNIKFGRFEPGTTRGHPDNDRMTMEHIMPWEYRVSKVGSQWRMRDKQAGMELNGIVSKRFEYAAGIVNGDGTTLDKNKMKDLYGRIGYKLGGMPIDGEEEIPETLATTNNWRDDTLMVGVYGYVGDSILPGGKDKAGKDITYESDFFRLGVDLRGRYQDLEVLAGAILGQDNDPDNTGKAVDSLGFFVEADYLFKPWLIGVARFGQLSFDDPNEKRNDFFTFTPNITILARPNVRLTLEALIQVEDVEKENKDNLRWIKGNVLYVF